MKRKNPIKLFRKLAYNGLQKVQTVYNEASYDYFSKPKKTRIRLGFVLFSLFLFITLLLSLYLYFHDLNSSLDFQFTKNPISSDRIFQITVVEKNPKKLERYLKIWHYTDFIDEYGWTALHWAAFNGDRDSVNVLLKNGADPNFKSKRTWYNFPTGSTPRDVSRIMGFNLDF